MEIAGRGCWSHTLWYALPHTEARVGSSYIALPHPVYFCSSFSSVSLPHCPRCSAPSLDVLGGCSYLGCATCGGVGGGQRKNWTLCKDGTKHSKVIQIRLEQVINESSTAVTGQSNIYRTSSISIAAVEGGMKSGFSQTCEGHEYCSASPKSACMHLVLKVVRHAEKRSGLCSTIC